MEHFFAGSELARIDRRGRVALPEFIRATLSRRSDRGSMLLVRHEADPCLVGFDRVELPHLAAELERRRLLDEQAGAAGDAHYARARRLFGLTSEVAIDGRGGVVLPELERRRLVIGEQALFIGTGAYFEIWSAERACAAADEAVADAARFLLGRVDTNDVA